MRKDQRREMVPSTVRREGCTCSASASSEAAYKWCLAWQSSAAAKWMEAGRGGREAEERCRRMSASTRTG